jgi:hypothetical protein
MIARRAEETSQVWDQVVSATDYLRELERPGFTVWDAVDEAVRWWIVDHLSVDGDTDDVPDLPWDDPDPLRTVLGELLSIVPSAGAPGGSALSAVLDAALVAWLGRTADRINDGHAFVRGNRDRG